MSCSECQTLLGQRFVMPISSLSFLSYTVASPNKVVWFYMILSYPHKVIICSEFIIYLLRRKRSRVMKTIICDNMS